MSANIKVETLLDAASKKYNIRATCGCGHVGVVDSGLMFRWYSCHCWPTTMMRVKDHLWCTRCRGGRPIHIGLTSALPDAPSRFPRDEAGWARLVRGLRG